MRGAGVVFDGVWKKFKRGERHNSLRDLLPALARRTFAGTQASALEEQEFWAVRDVSFEVREGEALGIIGSNGAGKSTILKLLTKILRPTQGACEVRGRAGALIEVAAGFHPDLTGRENVFLQGAIMGMKRSEIGRRFDEIVGFAGVGEFIDTPVKRYSSGMNARLGFAIAAHLDPDVLLIDEVLSVGDTAFQEKCLVRMRESIRSGIPVVFITHNLPAIVDLCTRALIIDRGTVQFDGNPSQAIQEYRRGPRAQAAAERARRAGPIHLSRVELLDGHGDPSAVFNTMDPVRVRITYEAVRPVEDAAFAVDIHRADGIYCVGINSFKDRQNVGCPVGMGQVDLVLPRLGTLPGCYLLSVGILNGSGTTYDLHDRGYAFTAVSDRTELGVMYLDHAWEYHSTPDGASGSQEAVQTAARGGLGTASVFVQA